MKKWLIILLLVLPLVGAQTENNDFYEYSTLDLNFQVNGNFDLLKDDSNARVDSIETSLTLFPKKSVREDVKRLDVEANPSASAVVKEEEIVFTWNDPNVESYTFSVDSDIQTRNVLHIIDSKVKFPVDEIETFYTQPTEYIDINQDIREKAKSIAGNEDDLYVVSHNVANWVQNNVNYDLSTLTANVVQKSSWVLVKKEGVCDEITNLYISMMRSLGVPARYVSGMAYSNLNHDWGPHAWAEVYFPDKGWVPFDVTYGQFGWLDPGHIALRQSLDSGDASVRYLWKASDIEFKQGTVNFKTSLVKSGEQVNSLIDFDVSLLNDKVGGGSYVPIVVKLKNNHNYYVPITLHALKAPEIIGKNTKKVLLKPLEEKTVYWVVKVPSNVETNYEYYTLVSIEDTFHQAKELKLTYGQKYDVITEDQVKQYEDENIQETVNVVNEPLSLENFKYTKEIGYDQEMDLEFLLFVTKPVTNVEMYVNNNLVLQIDSLNKTKQGSLKAYGRNFFKTSKIDVFLKYDDEIGTHTITKSYNVNVIGLPWYVKLLQMIGVI